MSRRTALEAATTREVPPVVRRHRRGARLVSVTLAVALVAAAVLVVLLDRSEATPGGSAATGGAAVAAAPAAGDAPEEGSGRATAPDGGTARAQVPPAAPAAPSADEDAAGAPRAGRDPATQEQTSLSQAASSQHVTPAGPPAGRVVAPRKPAQVLGDPARTGSFGNGCAVGYGRVDQCLPMRAPGGARTTCTYALTIFPHGVPVTGRDPLRLDTDRDGLACGPGDAGVPAGAHAGHDHAAADGSAM